MPNGLAPFSATEPAEDCAEYPYLEEVNEGIVRNFPPLPGESPGGLVLDLGCGAGRLGVELRKKGYQVWGVEQEPAVVQRAADRLDRAIVGDLRDPQAVISSLDGQPFDHLVFSDVLEHMANPAETLRAYLPLLRPGGNLFVSVPNVANWQTRLALMFGRFTYQDTGVLDRTHLRFFTRRTAASLVQDAGLEIARIDVTPMLVRAFLPLVKRTMLRGSDRAADPAAIVDSPLYARYMRYVYPLEYRLARVRPSLFAFRIIVVARRPENGAARRLA
jgi:2-polyprenyl-3-methyl-5-hydroxy-6-metoxy-1,4-benzoquinol methylase